MTEGRILLCAFSFCARDVFLFAKLTSVRTLSTLLDGLPLLISPDLNFAMFFSNVTLEEFVLRSLHAKVIYSICGIFEQRLVYKSLPVMPYKDLLLTSG